MESRTLRRADDDLVWEATWDGCSVEVALGPAEGDDAACRIETLEFESPRTAREYVDEETARLLEHGFELTGQERSPPPPAPEPRRTVDLGRVLRMEPRRAENPRMLAAIQADPDDESAYLVYADWLQEQGDPRGELVAIQHAARRSADLWRVAARVITHFDELLLPPGCDDPDAVRLRWQLGFIQGARFWPCTVSLPEVLSHPSSQVLRELSVEARPFCAAALDGRRLPCLEILKLMHVNVAQAKRLRTVLEGDHLPALRQLSLRDVDDLGPVLAPIVASGRLSELALLDVACEAVSNDDTLRSALEKCAAIPVARRPRLCLTVPDDAGLDYDPEARERLRELFVCVEPGAIPYCFALEDDQRHETYDDEYDDEIGDDILDRICEACGAPMDDPGYDPICEACGHDHGIHWDDDRYDDPVAEEKPDGDHGVDERWEAFKDDVFDLDEP